MMGKIAWVAGATGLVGQQLMQQLANDQRYSKVVAFVRRKSNQSWTQHEKVTELVINYDDLPDISLDGVDSKVDELFCALGTTKKQTPNQDQFYKIDVTYPNTFAALGKKQGAKFYGVVSAHGASLKSPFPYFKMKGDMEDQLSQASFERLAIARPGLLKGDRSEFRLMEKMSEFVTDILPGNYKSIHVKDVAAALIRSANQNTKGSDILESKAMQRAALI